MEKVASKYASALFELALEKKEDTVLLHEVKQIQTILDDHPEFVALLNKTQLDKREKKSLLLDVFKKNHPYLQNSLLLLIDRNRALLIPQFLQAYRHHYNMHHKIIEGIAYTVTPLPKEDLRALEKELSELEHQTVELTNRLDPRLIKGIKIRFGDKILDASMKTRIENLRNTLKEGRS